MTVRLFLATLCVLAVGLCVGAIVAVVVTSLRQRAGYYEQRMRRAVRRAAYRARGWRGSR